MDAQQLIQAFMSSPQGQQAATALQGQGIAEGDAQQLLAHAAQAAHDHVNEGASSAGLLGSHPGKSFFAAFAAGLVKGDGLFGALGDGLEGTMSGRIAEAVAAKAGIDPATASTVAAAATPYLVSFLKSHVAR